MGVVLASPGLSLLDGTPHLLVLGHVTRDEVGGGVRLGGAASYAALAAARLGVETALVTVGPPDDPLLAPLRAEPRLAIHCVPSPVMTTFALEYEGAKRRLSLRRAAPPLRADDVPPRWRAAAVTYVGPVAGECDRALLGALDARFVAAGLQGWLRRARGDGAQAGAIEPALSPEALQPPRLDAAILSEEDHPDAESVAARFAAAGALVAITRGARGATILEAGTRWELPAAPARETDPTGAGDVFGLVLALGLAAGTPARQAATAAAAAAARVVEGPGLGRLGLPAD
jgi:1D-myo-inositol 3-kinase